MKQKKLQNTENGGGIVLQCGVYFVFSGTDKRAEEATSRDEKQTAREKVAVSTSSSLLQWVPSACSSQDAETTH